MRRFKLLIAALCIFGSPQIASAQSSHDERRQVIEKMDENATPDALARKERSIARLKSENVPVIDHLPVTFGETQVKRRNVDEVAYRAMALLVVATKAEGVDAKFVRKLTERYRLAGHFSPIEEAFLNDPSPPEHDRIQLIWRYEAAWVLLWALGYVDDLEKPTEICDVKRAIDTLLDRNAEQFIADARLRAQSEILDEEDLNYRYHWAVVEARVNDQDAPAELDPGVVLERHHALNWLIGYFDQKWDEVSTDT